MFMRIIGIDPGYERLGVAIVEKNPHGKEVLIYSSCITTPKTAPHALRLLSIEAAITELISVHKPDAAAFEKLYFNTNQKTALLVAEARGVVVLAAAKAGLKIFEYAPQEIKIATTGYGKSDKTQIIKMIPLLIKMPLGGKRRDDEYDAIAVALTCFARERSLTR